MAFSKADNPRMALTPEEILEISREISLKFAPVPELPEKVRVVTGIKPGNMPVAVTSNSSKAIVYSSPVSGGSLSARELLEISSAINHQYAPKPSALTPELLILPVDPYHLYACWNMGEKLREKISAEPHDSALVLRIYWWPAKSDQYKESNVWLDVPVDQYAQRKQIRLPLADSVYSAAMGELLPDYSFDALAHSNQIRVPATGKKEMPFAVRKDKTLWELDAQTAQHSNTRQLPAQNWHIKLHCTQTAVKNDAAIIRMSRLSELFNQTGLAVQLIPESNFIESSPCYSPRASGQGISE